MTYLDRNGVAPIVVRVARRQDRDIVPANRDVGSGGDDPAGAAYNLLLDLVGRA